MFTMENTSGYVQEELDAMNAEVQRRLDSGELSFIDDENERLQQIEERVFDESF